MLLLLVGCFVSAWRTRPDENWFDVTMRMFQLQAVAIPTFAAILTLFFRPEETLMWLVGWVWCQKLANACGCELESVRVDVDRPVSVVWRPRRLSVITTSSGAEYHTPNRELLDMA